jgi:DNA-binding YbaB/EbfC family protein
MFQKLKQFQDMRDQAKKIQATLSQEIVEGTAGFGKVKITMNGTQEILSVVIDPSLMAPDEHTRLQNLIKDAANDAMKKCHKAMAEKMKGQMGDFKMPEL